MVNSWCCRCYKYTESEVGSAIVRIVNNTKIRITNLSCAECHTFKESIVEKILVQ